MQDTIPAISINLYVGTSLAFLYTKGVIINPTNKSIPIL